MDNDFMFYVKLPAAINSRMVLVIVQLNPYVCSY